MFGAVLVLGACDVGAFDDLVNEVAEAGAMEPAPDTSTPGCPHADTPELVTLTTTDLGEITIPAVQQPTLVTTALVGARVLWVFSDPPMAVWSVAGEPSGVPELQAPEPYVPLLPAGAVPAGTGSFGSAVAWNANEALFFFSSGFFLNPGDVGIGRIAVEQPQAAVVHAAGEMFPDHRFPAEGTDMAWALVFQTGAVVHREEDGTYLYVYACGANPNEPSEQRGGEFEGPCRVARAPIEQAQDGTSYRYWNRERWVSDVHHAAPILDHMPGGLSVSYNEYLQRFLAVHSREDNSVQLRYAERPEGPWQILGRFNTEEATAGFYTTTGAGEHPALRGPCHQTIYVSYILPLTVTDPGGTTTEINNTHLVAVELQ